MADCLNLLHGLRCRERFRRLDVPMTSVSRSARTGRFVTPQTAGRWPQYTSNETVGRGTGNARAVVRSVVTGRFAPSGDADNNPNGTITQRV